MSEDQYDDGLVHEHGWAREAMPEGITRLVAPVARPGAAASDAASMNRHAAEADRPGMGADRMHLAPARPQG